MSTSVAAEEGLGKTQEESKEIEKNPVKTTISGTGSANEDASKELETNGSIEVDIETTSPKKPPAPVQNEEKSEGTAEPNPVQRSQQNNVHNNNNNNNQPAVQQNSDEDKIELNTAREATPPPTVEEKKEEVVVKKNEQPVAAELPSKNSGPRLAIATAVNNHKEEGKKEEAPVEAEKKQGLPKWMVQSANAPPSPSPEATEKSEEKQESATATPAKGRGRGRRSAAQKAADAAAAQQSSTSDDKQADSTVHRPRRSTRTRVDYANPDPMTVVAEADDEEPGGAKRGSTARAYVGRLPAVGGESKRGRKRKVAAATSGEDEEREEDDDDEEYGSKKKAKKRSTGGTAKKAGASTAAAGTGKRRGRPAGSGNKAKAPKGGRAGRPATGGRRKRKADQDSDDEHAEVVYDDRESDKETTGDESAEEGIQVEEVKKTAPIRAPPTKAAAANKSPPKKRGRPPTKGKQSKTGASVPAEIKAAEQTDESAVGVGSGGDEPAAADTAQLGSQA